MTTTLVEATLKGRLLYSRLWRREDLAPGFFRGMESDIKGFIGHGIWLPRRQPLVALN